MDNYLQKTYFREIEDRCEACFAAVGEFNEILADRQSRKDLFRPAKEVIYQAGIISKLLWPPGSKNKERRKRAMTRGEILRRTLAVSQDHPIRNRALRDHFEHYDERLDSWAAESPNRNMVKRLVGPRSAIGGSAITDGDIIEHYDPELRRLSFRGEHFDFQELVAGLKIIPSGIAP